jgi:hypothetical protein
MNWINQSNYEELMLSRILGGAGGKAFSYDQPARVPLDRGRFIVKAWIDVRKQ